MASGAWLIAVDDVEVRLGGAGRLGMLEEDEAWDWDWADMEGRFMMGIFGSAPCPSGEGEGVATIDMSVACVVVGDDDVHEP